MPTKHSKAAGPPAPDIKQQFRLYVAGSSPRSLRAVQNVQRIFESKIPGRYNLEVVDIYKEPSRAAQDRVIALPTLIKDVPGLVQRLIGDLSEAALLRQGLEL